MRKLHLLFLFCVLAAIIFTILKMYPKTKSYLATPNNYDEYLKYVVQQKNPALCNEINFDQLTDDYLTTKETFRYFCKADYASKTNDIDMCRKLDSTHNAISGAISQRHSCTENIAIQTRDKNLCNEISTFADPIYTGRCLYKITNESNY